MAGFDLETIAVRVEGAVLFAEIKAPPMNPLGPELVRDFVSLIQRAEADEAIRVLVFTSGDPDFFISHVDLTRIAEYRAEAAFGLLPGGGATQHLTRLMGRGRALPADQLAPPEDFRRDSDLFGQGAAEPAAQRLIGAALQRGLQTRDAEIDLGQALVSVLAAEE
ncbi:hypothetical protein ACQPZX_14380 [Actinoplanes sp. CA-142083]|uniref:hypothetical protein n=1 Tax=Actinoplanes sp. CA-142083 TaxID=3239903 RepID=UPI003D8C986C